TNSPALSGPRWTSVALIPARRSGSTEPLADTTPQIPHMRRSVGTAYARPVHFTTHAQLILLALLAVLAALLIAAPKRRIPYATFRVLGVRPPGLVPGP